MAELTLEVKNLITEKIAYGIANFDGLGEGLYLEPEYEENAILIAEGIFEIIEECNVGVDIYEQP